MFRGLPVFRVALVCDEAKIRARQLQRGWGWNPKVRSRVRKKFRWYHENQRRFDLLVDTSQGGPGRNARQILRGLQLA